MSLPDSFAAAETDKASHHPTQYQKQTAGFGDDGSAENNIVHPVIIIAGIAVVKEPELEGDGPEIVEGRRAEIDSRWGQLGSPQSNCIAAGSYRESGISGAKSAHAGLHDQIRCQCSGIG